MWDQLLATHNGCFGIRYPLYPQRLEYEVPVRGGNDPAQTQIVTVSLDDVVSLRVRRDDQQRLTVCLHCAKQPKRTIAFRDDREGNFFLSRLSERCALLCPHLTAHGLSYSLDLRAAWRRTVENEIAKDAWIIDGNFGSSLELRLSRAQAAVYLDYSRAVCLAGVLRRVWTTHGRVRPDMGAGCPERFDLSFLRWVWDFPKRDGTHVKALLAAHPEVRCVTLKNRRDAQVPLRRLEGADDGSI